MTSTRTNHHGQQTTPIVIVKENNDYHGNTEVPFSPPVDGNFDFSSLLNMKRKQIIVEPQLDVNANITSTLNNEVQQNMPALNNNNNKSNQYLRVSLLKKNTIFDSDASLSSTSSSSSQEQSSSQSSTPSTSPFPIRKQNSELLNKMLEIAFANPIHTKPVPAQKCSNVKLNEYRELNTIVPDSL